jgi:ribosomal protein S18 acetylase RimI-like enzyme
MGVGPEDAVVPDDVVGFVAGLQRDPAHHVVFAGEVLELVAEELAGVDGWQEHLHVVRDDAGRVAAVLLAERDEQRDRVWWWGPWARDADVARRLLHEVAGALDAAEEEFAPDVRNVRLALLAAERGAVAGEGSAVLRLDPLVAPAGHDPTVPAHPTDVAGIEALHDTLFPGTHTTGAQLVAAADTVVRVVRDAGAVVGYVAVEVQPGGDGYVDYLGVDVERRGEGLGRALVAGGLRELAARGVGAAHLTVRVGNAPARALYASLGFVEERVAVPWRRGFDLG